MSEIISKRRWLHLPVEVKAREFSSKVLLACFAVEKGFGVCLGKNGFNLDGFYPRGIYFDKGGHLDKTTREGKHHFANFQVNMLGNRLVVLDEEGLLFTSDDIYLRSRTSQQLMKLYTHVFTWGEKQYNLLNKFYGLQGKLVQSGSPRVDLWRSRLRSIHNNEVKRLKEKYGHYILIPSNFMGIVDERKASDGIDKYVRNGVLKSASEISLWYKKNEYYKELRAAYFKAIPEMALEYKNYFIIIRPHPSDNHKEWKRLVGQWPNNVKVIYEGGVSSWILAADVVIHSNCTTAIEAYTMKVPVISFMPPFDELVGFKFPNSLGYVCNSSQELIDTVGKVLEKKEGKFSDGNYKYYIAYDEDILSSEIIVNYLDQIDLPELNFKVEHYGFLPRIKTLARRTKRRLRDYTGKNAFTYEYRMQKNSGMTVEEISVLISSFSDSLGRFQDMRCIQVGEDQFCIYS